MVFVLMLSMYGFSFRALDHGFKLKALNLGLGLMF
jgi:hypothetical protein